MLRTLVLCAACHSLHFEGEGYSAPSAQRYRINSISTRLEPDGEAQHAMRDRKGLAVVQAPDDVDARRGGRSPLRRGALFDLGEAEALGDRAAGAVGEVVHDFDVVGTDAEGFGRQRAGSAGRYAPAGVVVVEPIADLQATWADPAHQPAAADDLPVRREDGVTERGALRPLGFALFEEPGRRLAVVTVTDELHERP